ncbi:M18 family aminopeptidase [Aestuariirhabdus litorea]|uniref:M18 family aminopeptidase n=1 Tax=Aestuariirhabdus litorea TaxID=2528527 RepID=A0A3P3VN53_9GAMM|nr:M18 family aminopeptidase [Aestuariirhabdus litorea]RRJ84191.1 M18 family aminopeptidase [Aestuariirhabdus litorea]RWW97412.1 M18 family aminopeptidase [Endozoicomonadaceae bacterium GTF-13]
MGDASNLHPQLIDFLHRSPTPFHATREMSQRLLEAGFEQLDLSRRWKLQPYGRYFLTRNDSSLVAFTCADAAFTERGFRMVGAHTDSPCLRVKPNPELSQKGYFQLGVEVYGGALLNPWFDRDLSLAGRVSYRCKQGKLRSALLDLRDPIAFIPSLAIHLNREVNDKQSINPQTQLPPILSLCGEEKAPDFRAQLKQWLQGEHSDIDQVLDYELSFYDTQPPAVVGLKQEFIASARLDNLLSCFVGLSALLANSEKADQKAPCLLVCNDHEEVGSQSSSGAQGPLLASVLERILGERESLTICMENSLMISVDNAHGIHPNYADRHDGKHGPLLNAGPVIKLNSNQRYATNSESSSLFRHLCEQAEVPFQSFVVRSDMACGSTIGPITAAEIGTRTLDVGVPTFGMHSIRELAGADDLNYLHKALSLFMQQAELPFA